MPPQTHQTSATGPRHAPIVLLDEDEDPSSHPSHVVLKPSTSKPVSHDNRDNDVIVISSDDDEPRRAPQHNKVGAATRKEKAKDPSAPLGMSRSKRSRTTPAPRLGVPSSSTLTINNTASTSTTDSATAADTATFDTTQYDADMARMRDDIFKLQSKLYTAESKLTTTQADLKVTRADLITAIAAAKRPRTPPALVPVVNMEEAKRVARKAFAADLLEDLTCGVCTEPLWTPYVLACGHTFCLTCLDSWFARTLSAHTTTHPHFANFASGHTYLSLPPNQLLALLDPAARAHLQRQITAVAPQPQYNCPACRADVESKPVPDFGLKAQVRKCAAEAGVPVPRGEIQGSRAGGASAGAGGSGGGMGMHQQRLGATGPAGRFGVVPHYQHHQHQHHYQHPQAQSARPVVPQGPWDRFFPK